MFSAGDVDHAQLGAVRRPPPGSRGSMPRKTCRTTVPGTTFSIVCGLRRPQPDDVLAHRHRAGAARRRACRRCSAAWHRRRTRWDSSSACALDDVARADEAGDEFRARAVVDVLGRARLLDLAVVHHRDDVGGGHRLRLVVGDVDRGVAVLVVQPAHLEAHLLAQIGVEIGQRLVEQQRLGLDDQRARERDALLLAARQLARIAVGELRRDAWSPGSPRACA